MITSRFRIGIATLVMLVTACGASEARDDPPTTVTTTAPENVTTIAPESIEVVLTSDVVYHEDPRFRHGVGHVDVVAPASGGPWPVVVLLHGDPRQDDKEWALPMAQALAERGRVVFVPSWGHASSDWIFEATPTMLAEVDLEELRCALAFTQATATQYGGDPDRLTLAGYSAGGNAALTAGLSTSEPLAQCSTNESPALPQAVIAMDSDLLLGFPSWNGQLVEDPLLFYLRTPWRMLDPSHDFPVHIVAVDTVRSFLNIPLEGDPRDSFLVDRHPDIDLVTELLEMGLLDDGKLSIFEGQMWAYQSLLDAGYDAEWVVLPDSRHAMAGDARWGMSEEAWELAITTVVNAER